MAIPAYLEDQSGSASKRRKTSCDLKLQMNGARPRKSNSPVLVHDVSTHGLLLETDLAVPPGVKIAIELPHAGTTTATVIWRSEKLLACQFDAPVSIGALGATELQSAVHPDIAALPAEDPRAAEDFGARLRQLRKAKGLTQAELAARVGVSMPAVSTWEQGKALPRDARMRAVAAALDIPMPDLFGPQSAEGLEDLLGRSRDQIARMVGISPDKVRIMIEI